jgi:GrpB-like predicted nucleotidyltransferase (UPF0157 family)
MPERIGAVTIEIHDYDPGWPVAALTAMDELTAALDGRILRIEHIGSTAVPGLAAKPVIDLMAAVADLAPITAAEPTLTALGYRLIETGMRDRLFYRREGSPVAYHFHVVTEASWAERLERLLRDHLLEHPADRAEYEQLKRALAGAGHGGDEYTRAKTALIQRMVDDARTSRGLPIVPVWED